MGSHQEERRMARSYALTLEPVHTTTESNAKEHWRTKARRAKTQRVVTFRLLQHCLGR